MCILYMHLMCIGCLLRLLKIRLIKVFFYYGYDIGMFICLIIWPLNVIVSGNGYLSNSMLSLVEMIQEIFVHVRDAIIYEVKI